MDDSLSSEMKESKIKLLLIKGKVCAITNLTHPEILKMSRNLGSIQSKISVENKVFMNIQDQVSVI